MYTAERIRGRWWIARNNETGYTIRGEMYASRTDDECKAIMINRIRASEKARKLVDEHREKRQAEKAYKNSDEYILLRMREFKQKEEFALEKEVQHMKDNNNSRFIGGYTSGAMSDHEVEMKRIAAYCERRRLEIEKKYDGSPECKNTVCRMINNENMFHKITSGGSLGFPRVGGSAGAHAATHGGGFNHPGVYAGGVW